MSLKKHTVVWCLFPEKHIQMHFVIICHDNAKSHHIAQLYFKACDVIFHAAHFSSQLIWHEVKLLDCLYLWKLRVTAPLLSPPHCINGICGVYTVAVCCYVPSLCHCVQAEQQSKQKPSSLSRGEEAERGLTGGGRGKEADYLHTLLLCSSIIHPPGQLNALALYTAHTHMCRLKETNA